MGAAKASLKLDFCYTYNLKYMWMSSVFQIRDSHVRYMIMPLSVASTPATFQHVDSAVFGDVPNYTDCWQHSDFLLTEFSITVCSWNKQVQEIACL